MFFCNLAANMNYSAMSAPKFLDFAANFLNGD